MVSLRCAPGNRAWVSLIRGPLAGPREPTREAEDILHPITKILDSPSAMYAAHCLFKMVQSSALCAQGRTGRRSLRILLRRSFIC